MEYEVVPAEDEINKLGTEVRANPMLNLRDAGQRLARLLGAGVLPCDATELLRRYRHETSPGPLYDHCMARMCKLATTPMN